VKPFAVVVATKKIKPEEDGKERCGRKSLP
jgi:hypothetical protein